MRAAEEVRWVQKRARKRHSRKSNQIEFHSVGILKNGFEFADSAILVIQHCPTHRCRTLGKKENAISQQGQTVPHHNHSPRNALCALRASYPQQSEASW